MDGFLGGGDGENNKKFLTMLKSQFFLDGWLAGGKRKRIL